MTTIEASFALAAIREQRKRVIEYVTLPPHLFNVLTQIRDTYEVDPSMVESLLAKGQLTPGSVAVLNPAEAQVYVETFNAIFQSKHQLEDLTSIILDGEQCYLIIFAGHRRHYHCTKVRQGIETGDYEPTEAFDGSIYRAELHFGITPEEALERQFIENRYSAPAPHSEAKTAWAFFRYRRSYNPDLTQGQFARSIGRTVDWFRNAVRFCSLPESVQSYVLGDNLLGHKLPYTLLVDLARLAEGWESIMSEPLTEESMHRWVREAFVSELNATAFGRKVSAYLEDLRAQQAGQLSLFDLEESDAAHSKRMRRTVERQMVPGIWKVLQYVQSVERIRKAGMLGHESYLGPQRSTEDLALYSPGSPICLVSEMATAVECLMPHLAELARLERTGHLRRFQRRYPQIAEAAAIMRSFARWEKLQAAA